MLTIRRVLSILLPATEFQIMLYLQGGPKRVDVDKAS